MRQLTALVVVALFTGCSFAFVHGPESMHPPKPGDCTQSKLAPVVDSAATLVLITMGVALLASVAGDETCAEDNLGFCGLGSALAVTSLVAAVPWGISAVRGFIVTGRCSDAHEASVTLVPQP